MAETIAQPVHRKSKQRSRVGNGVKLLPATDGRSLTARRFKDLIDDIAGDLGGYSELSETQRQLIRRASLLSAEGERQEALWVRGEAEFDLMAYLMLTNCLRRVAEAIGLRRVAREAVTLENYLAAKDAAE
jgi:hypothetical protein